LEFLRQIFERRPPAVLGADREVEIESMEHLKQPPHAEVGRPPVLDRVNPCPACVRRDRKA
jgi:hypothetical protein